MPSAGLFKKVKSWLNADDMDDAEYDTMEMTPMASTPTPAQAPKRQRGPLTLQSNSEGGMEIRHPRTLEERMDIGTDLKQRRMVTLDLTRLPEAEARPFLEFVYGVVFALDASAEKVTDNIYLLAPRGVFVHNDTENTSATTTTTTFTPSRVSMAAGGKQEELFWQGR